MLICFHTYGSFGQALYILCDIRNALLLPKNTENRLRIVNTGPLYFKFRSSKYFEWRVDILWHVYAINAIATANASPQNMFV